MATVEEITTDDITPSVHPRHPNEDYDYVIKITQADAGMMYVMYRGETYSITRLFAIDLPDDRPPSGTVYTTIEPALGGKHRDEVVDEVEDEIQFSEKAREYADEGEWPKVKRQLAQECQEWYVDHPYKDANWHFPNGRPE